MRAIQLQDSAQGSALALAEVEQPSPGTGQVLIQVHAAGVTTTELNWYPTTHTPSGEDRRRAIPGHEFAGVVAALGESVSGFAVGDHVFGMNDWFQEGAMAEYCVTLPSSIASKPQRLTAIEAAAVPIGALTAWQGLFERAQLRPGERVLVQGGAGAVGLFAVQLAHLHGAYVIATTSRSTTEFVCGLGADEAIDYQTAHFEDFAGAIDVVFDTVGGATRERSHALLKETGRLVSIAADGDVTTDAAARAAYFIVEPNRGQLQEIARLLDDGRLKAFVKGVTPLERAADAFAGKVPGQKAFGKLVVAIQE